MKTQISNLRSGKKNQILNPNVDYSLLPKSTSHIGHAGDRFELVNDVWNKVVSENPEVITIQIFGQKLELVAKWSLSRKSVNYFTEISNEFLEKYFTIAASKKEKAYICIFSPTSIDVSNGKNSIISICPSHITIL